MVVKPQSRQKEEIQLVWWVGKMSNFDRGECFFISHILPGINVSFHHEHNCPLCLTKFMFLNLNYQTINMVWWQIRNWFWKALKNSVFLLRGTSVQKKNIQYVVLDGMTDYVLRDLLSTRAFWSEPIWLHKQIDLRDKPKLCSVFFI